MDFSQELAKSQWKEHKKWTWSTIVNFIVVVTEILALKTASDQDEAAWMIWPDCPLMLESETSSWL